MKYTKSIVAFLFLNLVLVFLMIFIANKTREIEKNNNNLKYEISKITENIKINKIELLTHQNSSYLKKLYHLYFFKPENKNIPKIVSIKKLSEEYNQLQLVKTKN
tara:strand:+ start:104 stop:418 length:315 start_codon:yes stop_codon:yes gene_type:complete